MDLDGVLINPGGYRAAVRASTAYLIAKMGLEIDPPGDEIPALFESIAVTSEWDMVSIILAILCDASAQKIGCVLPDLPLTEVLRWVRAQSVRGLVIDYLGYLRSLETVMHPGGLPTHTLLTAIREGHGLHLFPTFADQIFVSDILKDSRRAEKSMAVRLVQNYVLGDEIFIRTYQLPALVKTHSLLVELDHPALLPELSARMMDLHRSKQLGLASFTARPSLPPAGSGEEPQGYSPEAEMALDLVDFGGIPVIGYGHLEWLAKYYGGIADDYMKPAALQPLAALYAAITGREGDGLDWAFHLVEGKRVDPLPISGALELHAFEDSSIGIVGARRAAEILRTSGLTVKLFCWGVAVHPEKVSALEKVGAKVFPDVNQAIRAAFLDLVE